MLNTTSHTLKRLAALVWYVGVVVLLIKSSGLFLDAGKCGVNPPWLMVAVVSGLMIGWFKAKYLFITVCKRNLDRINALRQPMFWQFYRPRFFVFLCLMILSGRYLAKLAQGNDLMLISLAVVELSVAIALLVSSHCFWRE